MPTIEIVSIESAGLNLNEDDFTIALIEDKKMESHRGIFYDFLIEQNGTMIHIGNPDMKDDKDIFFGNLLIDWSFDDTPVQIPEVDPNEPIIDTGANQLFRFKFLDIYRKDIDTVLKRAIESSPIKKVYFLTDYQFGPGTSNKEIIYTRTDFWDRHDTVGLVYNTLYELYG